MDDVLAMYVRDKGNEDICQEQYRLERELAVAVYKDILQVEAETIEYQDLAATVTAEPVDVRDTLASLQQLVNTSLMFGIEATELDGNFFVGGGVGAKEYDAGGAIPSSYIFSMRY